MRQGELQARRAVVVKINRFFRILRKRALAVEQSGDLRNLIDSGPQIDLGVFLTDGTVFVPLGQAAGDYQQPSRLFLFPGDAVFDRFASFVAAAG